MSSTSSDRTSSGEQPEDSATRAKNICLRLLTARPRTRSELRDAVLRKGIEEEVVDLVLQRLDKVGLIDDAAFAEMWVRSRHNYSGMARRALLTELRRKGVDDSIATEAASAVDGAAEEERARTLVRKKLRTSMGTDDTTRLRRLVGVLARKGYPQGMAYRVVKEELRTEGQDSEILDELIPE
ncbi:MAG: regulatory protein RecX [Sciscionella sp.]